MVLPIVLVMMVMGSLLILPSINYVSTSLKTGGMIEEKIKGLYAAEVGVEDALWKIKNDTPPFSPYQITGINGMLVDVTIDGIDTLVGEELGESGGHEEWLVITKSTTYDSETGIYSYDMSLSNNGSGNIKILKILIYFPQNLEYVVGSTSSNITIPVNDDPTVIGEPSTGITLKWEIPVDQAPDIAKEETVWHHFRLSGPPDIDGVEGHGVVEAHRTDIGTVWGSESYPYSITAQAKNAAGIVITTIRAGVWTGDQLDISCWQINP